jgi:hypothetical protein
LVANVLVVNQKLFQLPYSKTNIKRGRKRRSSRKRRKRRRAYNIEIISPFEVFDQTKTVLDPQKTAFFTSES